MTQTLLDVRGLRTRLETRAGRVCAVDGVDVTVQRGECLGGGRKRIGEKRDVFIRDGAGEKPRSVDEGTISFDGRDLQRCPRPRCARCGAAISR